MTRVILRFHSLALREEASQSTIHFDVEDDTAIHRCRAHVEERDEGRIEVGPIEAYDGIVDHETFAGIVAKVVRDQVQLIARLTGDALVTSCIVALRELEVVVEEGRIAAGW